MHPTPVPSPIALVPIASSARLASRRIPPFAVPNAVDVLGSGSYSRFPQSIGEMAAKPAPTKAELEGAVKWLDHRLSASLIDTKLPMELTHVKIANGRLWLREERLYEISVTLQDADPKVPWRLLSVDVLVMPEGTAQDEAEQTRLVGQDQIPQLHQKLSERLAAPTINHPLHFALMTLRGFCLGLKLTLMVDEANKLMVSRWRNLVHLKVGKQLLHMHYWMKALSSGGNDVEGSPKLRLELVGDEEDIEKDQCPRHAFRITHAPSLIDPATGKTALFSSVDHTVQQLFDRAIGLHMHRLLLQLVDTLKEAAVFPSGIPQFELDFDEANAAEAVVVLNFQPPEALDGSENGPDVVVPIQILVDRSTGRYVIHCSSFDADPAWKNFAVFMTRV